MLVVLAFGVLLAGAFLLADAVIVPLRQRRASIARATRYGGPALERPAGPRAGERVIAPLGRRFARLILRVSPKGLVESIDKRLAKAGLRRISVAGFVGLKVLAGVSGATLGILVGSARGSGLTAPVFGLMFGAMLFILPDRLLAGRARKRGERIQADLPDALDLLAISVEAGLGLDGAIAVLIEHMRGPLADEFALALSQIRVGESRQEALRALGQRVDVPEMSAFTRAIIQSDQLGISLGRILHMQARDARVARQGAAEEKANKLPIKMLFPTIIFIFPPLFLVILGPAFIQILQTL